MRYIDIAAAEIDDDADLDEEDAESVSAPGLYLLSSWFVHKCLDVRHV